MTTFEFIRCIVSGHWLKLDGRSIVYETNRTDPAVRIVLFEAKEFFLKGLPSALNLVESLFKLFLFFLKGTVTIAYFLNVPFRKFNKFVFQSGAPVHNAELRRAADEL
jgi:hypothetical protein